MHQPLVTRDCEFMQLWDRNHKQSTIVRLGSSTNQTESSNLNYMHPGPANRTGMAGVLFCRPAKLSHTSDQWGFDEVVTLSGMMYASIIVFTSQFLGYCIKRYLTFTIYIIHLLKAHAKASRILKPHTEALCLKKSRIHLLHKIIVKTKIRKRASGMRSPYTVTYNSKQNRIGSVYFFQRLYHTASTLSISRRLLIAEISDMWASICGQRRSTFRILLETCKFYLLPLYTIILFVDYWDFLNYIINYVRLL